MDEEPNWRDSPIGNNFGCIILIGMAVALAVGIFVLGNSIMNNKDNLKPKDAIEK